MSSSDLFTGKILPFLLEEFKRTENPCVQLDLLYSQGAGFRDEELQSWVRTDKPELFDDLRQTEDLARFIVKRVEDHADAFGSPLRFHLRAQKHLGGRTPLHFQVRPSSTLTVQDEHHGVPQMASGPRNPMDSQVNALNIAMRAVQGMHQGTVGAMVSTNKSLLEENQDYRARIRDLEKRLDEAESTRMERQWNIEQQARKMNRSDKTFEKILSMGTVVIGKLLAGGEGGPGIDMGMAGAGGGAPGGLPAGDASAAQSGDAVTSLVIMIVQLGESIDVDQFPKIAAALTPPQQKMFYDIMQLASRAMQEVQAQKEAALAAQNAQKAG